MRGIDATRAELLRAFAGGFRARERGDSRPNDRLECWGSVGELE